MDTSDKYIKMCEKAVEIQSGWNPEPGDFFFTDKGLQVLGCNWFCADYKYPTYRFAITKDIDPFWVKNDCLVDEISYRQGEYIFKRYSHPIFLPKQDQLQDMISYKPYMLLEFFSQCVNELQYYDKDITMEQLWLIFIMETKYRKQWTGEDWE